MDPAEFLFTSKDPSTADPLWLIVGAAIWAVLLIVLSIWGPRVWTKERHQALHKSLKKSSFWLKFFGITALVLLWIRLEAVRFFSMKFWLLLYALGFLLFLFFRLRYYMKLRRRIARRGEF